MPILDLLFSCYRVLDPLEMFIIDQRMNMVFFGELAACFLFMLKRSANDTVSDSRIKRFVFTARENIEITFFHPSLLLRDSCAAQARRWMPDQVRHDG